MQNILVIVSTKQAGITKRFIARQREENYISSILPALRRSIVRSNEPVFITASSFVHWDESRHTDKETVRYVTVRLKRNEYRVHLNAAMIYLSIWNDVPRSRN